jgi:hypothetical protein
MKKASAIFIFTVLLMSGRAEAQSKDSVPAKKIIEQGAKGDIITGKEVKKKQLNAPPKMLKQQDSAHKKTYMGPKKKKLKSKTRKTGK